MKNIVTYMLFILTVIPFTVSAQTPLSLEHKTFFKSLSGRWNPNATHIREWQSWYLDITLKFINGKVRVGYPASIHKLDESTGFFCVDVQTVEATFYTSTNCLSFSYSTDILMK